MGVKLRDIVHITLIVLMVVGFLAHMWHQTNKFFTGLTTVGVSYEDRSSIKFPTFAFCDSRAYNVRQPFAATATLYNATAFNVEEEVVLSGVFGLADQSTLMPANHTVRVFPTTYNGLCKSYEFHDVHKVRTYGEFQMPQNRKFDVFILEDGSEYQLVTQNFLRLQPTLTMTSDAVATLSLTMRKIANKNCKDISAKILSKCIIAKIEEALPPLKMSCLPYQFHNLFSGLQAEYPLCTNESLAMGYVWMIHSLVSDVIINRTELGCPIPCTSHEYRLTKSNLGTNTNVHRVVLLQVVAFDLNFSLQEGKMSLYPFYNLPTIKIEEEYTLMDAAAMITATGGSLSIFVGLSCYGCIWRVFEWLEKSFYRPRGKFVSPV